MTIAISLKVPDGMVFASDSAATFSTEDPRTGEEEVVNIYNNATKIFRLHKDLPIGAIAWGRASLGDYSLKILAKVFRDRLMSDAAFDPSNYTMEDIVQRFKLFIFDEHYQGAFSASETKPFLGLMVAGYSSHQLLGEIWKIEMDDGWCRAPILEIATDAVGVLWEGMPESLDRLMCGFSEDKLIEVLEKTGLERDQINAIIQGCREDLAAPLLDTAMPIQDAINLAIFMAKTAIDYTRFCSGPDSVGGPIEVAALTKYEGFKWVRRKHWYDRKLNS